ncbi:MAG: phage holin family protein [Gemmatimonadota bacterium]|nr:phage holin family protein [Gemmatimonadota bacterium]
MTVSDPGIPDLIRRLSDDSKRLVSDEVNLAKIEAKESLSRATRGFMWLGLALGVAIVMFTALTVFLTTLIGRAVNGHMWVGAIITGIVELCLGVYLVKRAFIAIKGPSYSLEASRLALADTAHWVSSSKRS